MARKPTRADAHTDSNPSASGPEHAPLALAQALSYLHANCLNARLFRELAQRRKRMAAIHIRNLNQRAQLAHDRADELARRGAPAQEQWAAREEAMRGWDDPPPCNEPAELRENLRGVLDDGRKLIQQARAAMRAGGAKEWDAATQPNASGRSRSIELNMKLQSAEEVYLQLTAAVGIPTFQMDEPLAKMEELGEYFGEARDELVAVMETQCAHGKGDATPQALSNGASDEVKPADPTLRDLATEAGISDDTFRRVRIAAGIEVNLKGTKARNRRYSPAEVDRLIAAALAGDFLERKAMSEKWAKWGRK